MMPFTTFTITNNSDTPTFFYDFYIRRTGTAADAVISRVLIQQMSPYGLVASDSIYTSGMWRVGMNPYYTYLFRLNPGDSLSFTIYAQMSASYGSEVGKTAGLQLVGVNASIPVSTSFPITGATHTLTL